ncbi:MAG TPA: tetratricopeptide repeat protein [archaeon]|nr:tetratricopeptide repeat protein [archaeon]
MKESRLQNGSRPEAEEVGSRLKRMRLGFFGTLGLYGIVFFAVQVVFYLYGGLLGGPGVYRPDGGFMELTVEAWIISLLLPAVFCYAFLRRQDARNYELLTRTWDSWRWFDYGVEMIGTDFEYSVEQEECFARSSVLDPEDPYARNNLGAVLWHQGRIDEAIEAYRRAIKNNPDYYKAYSNLGAAYARRGEINLAVGLYRKALTLNPRDAATHLNLGLALARLGSISQAITHLKQFLKLAPDHPRAPEISDYMRQLTFAGTQKGSTAINQGQ